MSAELQIEEDFHRLMWDVEDVQASEKEIDHAT